MSLVESWKPVFVCNQILTVTCLYIMECVMFVLLLIFVMMKPHVNEISTFLI